MNSEECSTSMTNRSILSASLTTETNLSLEQKKEGLTTKLRQTINAAGKRIQSSRQRKISLPDLTDLTSQSQQLILHAVETIKNEDSKNVMIVLDESRNLLRNSFEEFKNDQNEYRKQLEDITRRKEAIMQRRKENAIPLSIFMRQKRDFQGLADLRPNSGMNITYQAYFEALLAPNQNQQQHPSDKAAVIKYIRRRERRKRADENRKNYQLSDEILEKQTTKILDNKDGMNVKLEHERQRQNDLLRTKINEKKLKTKNINEVNEIIDQAHEANLILQRVEQKQRDKIEAHVIEVRSRTPTNIIHVQSREDGINQLNTEQQSVTQNSIQLLNDNDNYKPIRSKTPIYGDDDDLNEKVANVYI